MAHLCRHCGALHWIGESVRSSASRPEFVHLDPLPDPPLELRALYTGDDVPSREFRLNVRQYNFALSFTSYEVNEQDVNHGGRGPWIYKVGYQLFHRAGSLLPLEGQWPRYAQLYFYDAQDALHYRMQLNPNLCPNTMATLQRVIFDSHHYTRVYMQAYEILQQHPAEDIEIRLIADPQQDQRRYNLPTADEVAVIIPGDENQVLDPRDIILRRRSGRLHHISDMSPLYAPLSYVLLFPYGTRGWTHTMRLRERSNHHGSSSDPEAREDPEAHARRHRRLTQVQFYSHQLHVRPNQFPILHHGGRLFQQYLCDSWVSTDQNRLRWMEMNQPKLRAALYSGLEDAVARNDDNLELHEIGRRTVLPSSYVGGPRYMHQHFQDAMALARYFHKFDLFITMTCNPTWPEIIRELLPGQTAADRPDLVA
ncbi:hypothetical protein K474DRAFT_1694009 [Panus rudis PR-1116 ss-1]|nr:hypothetical protein K474DRAFT_1694009 [Panus rudis PR-1116 ss-1]